MLVSIIPIGDSKGIRLPKAIPEQPNIQDTLDLEVEEKRSCLDESKLRILMNAGITEANINQYGRFNDLLRKFILGGGDVLYLRNNKSSVRYAAIFSPRGK